MSFEIVKKNFERGLWSIQVVKIAVQKGVITSEQFLEITGEQYTLN